MKRKIRLNGIDAEFEISKVTAINLDNGKSMIHFDKLPDGTWRLTYNKSVIPDLTKLTSFDIIRED